MSSFATRMMVRVVDDLELDMADSEENENKLVLVPSERVFDELVSLARVRIEGEIKINPELQEIRVIRRQRYFRAEPILMNYGLKIQSLKDCVVIEFVPLRYFVHRAGEFEDYKDLNLALGAYFNYKESVDNGL